MHQLENGYTKIANTLLEVLVKKPIPQNSLRLIIWAIRNSYGFNRKHTSAASIRGISKNINMSRSSVQLALKGLIFNKIFIKNKNGGFDFNKNKVAEFTTLPASPLAPLPPCQPTGQKGPAHWPPPASPLAEKASPLAPIQSSLKKNLNKIRVKKERKVFTPPLLSEVRAFCLERKNQVNPDKWFSHYESNGWLVGKNKMKDWKASVRYWEHSDFNEQKKHIGNLAAPIPGKYDGIGEKA